MWRALEACTCLFFPQTLSSIVPEPHESGILSGYAAYSPWRPIRKTQHHDRRTENPDVTKTRTGCACHRHTNLRGGKASPLQYRLFSSAKYTALSQATRSRHYAKARRHRSSTGCSALYGSRFSLAGDHELRFSQNCFFQIQLDLRQLPLCWNTSTAVGSSRAAVEQ